MIQPNDLYNPKQQMPHADLSFITKSNFINVLTKLNYSKYAINLEDLYEKITTYFVYSRVKFTLYF